MVVFSQTVGELRYDTLKLRKLGGNSELVIMNSTRDSAGVLTNVGGGKTRFVKSKIIGDTLIVIGVDTLKISPGQSVAGSDKQVQFNDGGALGAEAGFEYDKALHKLYADSVEIPGGVLRISGLTNNRLLIQQGNKVNVASSMQISGNDLILGTGSLLSYYKIYPKTANYTPNVNEHRGMFTNEGATGPITFQLPAAATGRDYSFYVENSNGITITAGTGDVIHLGDSVTAAAGSVSFYQVGKVVRLVAINSTDWIQVNTDVTAFMVKKMIADSISLKVNISDTSGMLSPYLRKDNLGDSLSELKTPATVDEINTGVSTRYITPDSLEISKYKATNPGVYFSPANNMNPGFVVMASAIVRPTNSYDLGQPITWGLITTGGHNSSFFTSVEGESSGELKVSYPTVKNILNITIIPDETFLANGISVGPSVGPSSFTTPLKRYQSVGIRLTGDGSGGWTKSSLSNLYNGLFTVSTYNTSTGVVNLAITGLYGIDLNTLTITYSGPERYTIQRKWTGIPGGYDASFIILDETGSPLGTNPTTDDNIIISNGGMYAASVITNTWNAVNSFMSSGTANFWITGLFECWMVATPVSLSSINIRWQTTYPDASTYKIYRSDDEDFTSPVLIHTGTEGTFTDSGLSSNTMYYYKLVAVVSGVDTDVTTFNTNTFF